MNTQASTQASTQVSTQVSTQAATKYPTLAAYCKAAGMDKQEFNVVRSFVDDAAQVVINSFKKSGYAGNGMYYSASWFIPAALACAVDTLTHELEPYVRQACRKLGVEFIEDGELMRY